MLSDGLCVSEYAVRTVPCFLWSPLLILRECARQFILSKYPEIKQHNPDLPVLIREASGTPARIFARFGTPRGPVSKISDQRCIRRDGSREARRAGQPVCSRGRIESRVTTRAIEDILLLRSGHCFQMYKNSIIGLLPHIYSLRV